MSRIEATTKASIRASRFKIIVVCATCIFIITMVLISPLFEILQIEIIGNSVVDSSTILQLSGLSKDMNIFSFRKSKAADNIESDPYIKTAAIAREYPNKITISVQERAPKAYVKCSNFDTYLLIDEEGMVLESSTYVNSIYPVVVGLNFTNFAEGEYLNSDNMDAFDKVVTLSRLFSKYKIEDVIKVDMADENNIHLYANNVDILFGDIDNADKKIQYIKEIIKTIPKEERGFLHIEDLNQVPRFEPMK